MQFITFAILTTVFGLAAAQSTSACPAQKYEHVLEMFVS